MQSLCYLTQKNIINNTKIFQINQGGIYMEVICKNCINFLNGYCLYDDDEVDEYECCQYFLEVD